MPRKVIAVVSLSSCLITSANWTDRSQSHYRRAIKLLGRKRRSLAGGIPSDFTEEKKKRVAMQISQLARRSEELLVKIAWKNFLNNGRHDTRLWKMQKWTDGCVPPKSSGCGGLMQRLWLRSPAWCYQFRFFYCAFFLLEWEEHFPCGLEGFHEQAEGENIVDIKLFLFKGIVVTRWSSHHSK